MKYGLLFALTFICDGASAQLQKGTFIIGGSGSFQYTNYDVEGDPHHKFSEFAASPAVGVFVVKKLALGMRFTYSGVKQIVDTPSYKYGNKNYQYSPFIRYYLLSNKKPYNIIADASFDFQVITYKRDDQKVKNTGSGFSISAGPVIFFSPQTALEWSIGYRGTKIGEKVYSFFTAIGFQFHFKK